MKGRIPVFLVVLALIYSTACTFSTMVAPAAAPTVAPTIEPTVDARPQTSFIDGRTVSDDPSGSPAATPELSAMSAPAGGNVYNNSNNTTYNTTYNNYSGGSSPSGNSYPSGYPQQGYSCSPRGDWAYTYVVHPGDTLSNIAVRAGVSWQTLAQANCIPDPNRIFVGQVLRVPCQIAYNSYPGYPQNPGYPQYPPPHQYPPPPHTYPTPYPTLAPTSAPPTPIPPVVVGSGLTITPFLSVNNNTFILPPDQFVTFSWNGNFPAATDHVEFILSLPAGGTQGMGIDYNVGDGVSIQWNAVNMLQGTVQAVAYFQGGYPPQYSDSYYIIDGNP